MKLSSDVRLLINQPHRIHQVGALFEEIQSTDAAEKIFTDPFLDIKRAEKKEILERDSTRDRVDGYKGDHLE